MNIVYTRIQLEMSNKKAHQVCRLDASAPEPGRAIGSAGIPLWLIEKLGGFSHFLHCRPIVSRSDVIGVQAENHRSNIGGIHGLQQHYRGIRGFFGFIMSALQKKHSTFFDLFDWGFFSKIPCAKIGLQTAGHRQQLSGQLRKKNGGCDQDIVAFR